MLVGERPSDGKWFDLPGAFAEVKCDWQVKQSPARVAKLENLPLLAIHESFWLAESLMELELRFDNQLM